MLNWAKIQDGMKVMIEEPEARCLWGLAQKFDVPGDVLEFGSYAGISACVLSLALRQRHDGRILHCFDGWEGLPEGREGKDSDIIEAGHLSLGGSVDFFEKTVKERGAFEVVQIHKGWFKDTLVDVADIPRIAMLWCDVDRYDSIMEVLDTCWDKLEIGGYFATHDIGVTQTKGVYIALKEWGLLDHLTRVGTWTGWVQKTAELAAAIKHPPAEELQIMYATESFLSPSILNDPLYLFTIPGVEEKQLLEFSANDPTLINLDTLTPMYDLSVFGRYAGYIALTLNEERRVLSFATHLRPHASYLEPHVERWFSQQSQRGEPFIAGVEQIAKVRGGNLGHKARSPIKERRDPCLKDSVS
jgi:hypothetical protein